jgi:lipopolysaccharide transport system ATP-binding protein
MYVVGIAVSTFDPMIVHFFVREALTFQTTEALGPTSARGDFHGHLPGMVRPILNWEVSKGEVDRQDNAVWAKGRLAVQHEASR